MKVTRETLLVPFNDEGYEERRWPKRVAVFRSEMIVQVGDDLGHAVVSTTPAEYAAADHDELTASIRQELRASILRAIEKKIFGVLP